MPLLANRVSLFQPPADLCIDVRRREDPKMVDMISSGDRFDLAESLVFQPACQHNVPVDPVAAWRELSERHADLKRDPGLLREHPHRPMASHRSEYRIEHRTHNRRLACEMGRK